MSERLWWMSFVHKDKPEGQKFAGACVVAGTDYLDAVQESHSRGCNPGGEMLALECPPDSVPLIRQRAPEFIGVLLSRERCEDFDLIMEAVSE